MDAAVAAAEAALGEGRRDAAIAGLIAALTDGATEDAEAYLLLGRQLYLAGRHAEGARWTARGVERHPQAYALWNLQGVLLRLLRRPAEALEALERAIALAPAEEGARVNRGAVLLDLGRAREARDAFAELCEAAPGSAAHLSNLARAEAALGETGAARDRLRQALAAKPDHVEAWLQLAALDRARPQAAAAVLDEGLAANPDDPRLAEAKALALRTAGRPAEAEAYLAGLLPRLDGQAFVHFQLGDLIVERDRARGVAHLRRALALSPSLHHLALLAQGLARATGPEEGACLEEAWGLAREALEMGELNPGHRKILSEVFSRVCAFDEMDRLGDFHALGRAWAESGRHTALMRQLPRVRSLEDRLELVEQHRIWGRGVEASAAADPIRIHPPRPPDGRIRLGLMSSDLRRHPVGYFAAPLFDHRDPRFDLHVYSFFQREEDAVQRDLAGKAAAVRCMPQASAREAAQAIADDRLDMLIELGGTTAMNRLEVLAWRPAPVQASWLGYPHSGGLKAIDYLICDPQTAPADPRLMLETPLTMPRTWVALGRAVFDDRHAVDPTPPQDRSGALTFGTANNPYKFTREGLRAWARVVAATPGSRFAFIRPEAGAAAFRTHVLAQFAAEGVEAERVVFHAVRGAHMPLYNEVDISLDTFPLTGGTTTVEALWMGVPVVSLRGPAIYERLSASLLANAGLGDLLADDLAGFERIALALAADRPRRAALRQGLRAQLRQGPLGDTEGFARDFYAMLAAALRRP